MKKILSVTALSLSLAACGSTTTSQVTAVATDTATLVADIQSDVATKTLTAAQAAKVATDTAQLSADVAALNAGTSTTTVAGVLSDVSWVVNDIGPFLPDIEALVALAATPGSAASPMAQKLSGDYARLKADAK